MNDQFETAEQTAARAAAENEARDAGKTPEEILAAGDAAAAAVVFDEPQPVDADGNLIPPPSETPFGDALKELDPEPEDVPAPPQENTVVTGPDAGETGQQMERRMAAENAENPPEPIDVPNRGPLG